MNLPLVTIGCDGSVYKQHPTYKTELDSKIEDLLLSQNRVTGPFDSLFDCGTWLVFQFKLRLSEDGSGRGAALIAAVACRFLSQQSKVVALKSKCLIFLLATAFFRTA